MFKRVSRTLRLLFLVGGMGGVFLFPILSYAVINSDPATTTQERKSSVTASLKMESSNEAQTNLEDVRNKASYLGLKISLSTLLIVLGFITIKTLVYVLNALSERAASYRFLKKLGPFVQVVIWMGVIYIIIVVVFQPVKETFFAFMTASGVAIGFAAQDMLKNIFGGLTIILDRPFQVGDKIQVGDYYGEVTEIGLRTTRIVTPDDSMVSIPNSEVVSKSVSNANSGELDCQVVTEILVPSGINLVEARAIAWEAAVTSQYVFLKKPVSVMMVDAPTDRVVRTKLRVKAYVIDTRLEFVFATDVLEATKEEFRKRGFYLADDTNGSDRFSSVAL